MIPPSSAFQAVIPKCCSNETGVSRKMSAQRAVFSSWKQNYGAKSDPNLAFSWPWNRSGGKNTGAMNRTLGKGSTCSKTLLNFCLASYQQLSNTVSFWGDRDWVWIAMTVSERERMHLTSPSWPQASQEPVLWTDLVGYLFLHSVYPQHTPTNSHWQGTESSLNGHSKEHRTTIAQRYTERWRWRSEYISLASKPFEIPQETNTCISPWIPDISCLLAQNTEVFHVCKFVKEHLACSETGGDR